jgi:hypothetical protein
LFTSFLNFYNVLLLDQIAPGAFIVLIVSFVLARWLTRRSALREAQQHADRLALAGDDRLNFLEWRIQESLEAAEQRVWPTTGFVFSGLMMVALTTGLLSCGGPKEQKPTPPAPGPKAEQGVGSLPADFAGKWPMS